MHLELVIHEGESVRRIPLKGPLVLGRDTECDVVLTHKKISRKHCRIALSEGSVRITDLGSSNGTFVDGREISQVRMSPGQSTVLGDAVVVKIAWSEPAPQPAAEVQTRKPAPKAEVARPAPHAERGHRGRGRMQSRRSSAPAYVACGVVFVLALGLLFFSGGDAREEEADQLAGRVEESCEKGNHEGALRNLENLLKRYPDSIAARRLEGRLAELRATVSERTRLWRELEEIVARHDALGGAALLQQVRTKVGQGSAIVSVAETRAWVQRATEAAERSAARLLASTSLKVEAYARAGNYGPACRILSEAEDSPLLYGEAKKTLFSLRDRILGEASSAFGTVLEEVRSAPHPQAVAALKSALPRFQGTSHGIEIRARLRLLQMSAQGSSEKPAAAAAAPEPVDTSGKFLTLMTEVENFVVRRRYLKALPVLDALLEIASAGQKPHLVRRRDRIRRLAILMDAVLDDIKRRPNAYHRIDLGGSLVGRVAHANREEISFSLGHGARAKWDWARLAVDKVYAIMSRASLAAEQQLALGELFLDCEANTFCLRVMVNAWPTAGSLRSRIRELVAEARGMRSVPDGGFVLADGRFLTLKEKAERDLRLKLEELGQAVVRASAGEWITAAAQLRKLGARGVVTLHRSLRQRVAALRDRLQGFGPLARRALPATRARLATVLAERRVAALKLIFDGKRYPYPYGADQKKVQAEVDRLVQAVEEVWRRPARLLVGRGKDLAALVDDALAAEKVLTEDEAPADNEPTVAAILDAMDKAVGMRSFAADGRTMKRLSRWKEVKARNDSLRDVVREGERGVHRLTNAYRLMMGLDAVWIDEALVKAARGHSQEMKDMGYFAHDSPVAEHRTPSMRARLAGWSGRVSENIARGSKDPAHVLRQWLGSSGHHRNILGRNHSHLGVGNSDEGTFWTQNFARGPAKPRSKKD